MTDKKEIILSYTQVLIDSTQVSVEKGDHSRHDGVALLAFGLLKMIGENTNSVGFEQALNNILKSFSPVVQTRITQIIAEIISESIE